MAPPRGPATRVAGRIGTCLALLVALTGCTDGGPRPEPSPSSSAAVALGVRTVSGGDDLPARARTEVETAVGDVLSAYVSRAFLGDFPRRDFVPAFESFTSGAARRATRDIDLMTAALVQDATDVRATRLDSRLSLLVASGEVLGATAAVTFTFEATMPGGGTQPVTLRGRFMLSHEQGTWSVFGYDVAGDDGGSAVDGAG